MVTVRAEAWQKPRLETSIAKEHVNLVTSRICDLMAFSIPALQSGMIGMLPTESRTIDKLREMFCLDTDLDFGVPKTGFIKEDSLVTCCIGSEMRENRQSICLSFTPSWKVQVPQRAITSRIETIEIDQWIERNLVLIRVITDDAGVFNAAVKINGREGRVNVNFAVINNPFGDGRLYPQDSVTGSFDGKTGKLLPSLANFC